MDLFPTALLRLRMTPQPHVCSLYKIVYGRPPPIIKQVSTNLLQVRGDEISQQMEQLGKVINQVTKFVQERVPFPLGEQIHEFVPEDQVWSRTGHTTPWPHGGRVLYCWFNQPYCSESCRCHPWIHHRRVKTAYNADLEDAEWTTQRTLLIPVKPRSS